MCSETNVGPAQFCLLRKYVDEIENPLTKVHLLNKIYYYSYPSKQDKLFIFYSIKVVNINHFNSKLQSLLPNIVSTL